MGPYVFEENCWILKKYINPTFPPTLQTYFLFIFLLIDIRTKLQACDLKSK